MRRHHSLPETEGMIMNCCNDDLLWQRIRDFQLDIPGDQFPFSMRLARENDWSRQFTRRVIYEYKRFCYVAMTAGHPVTPSEEVDQVWHLHLLYTHSYWEDFCESVLQRPFHHGPTRGGAEEGSKYRDWYQATLESYQRIFGSHPPTDIWPPVETRFKHVEAFRRVNTASHWVIRKLLNQTLLFGSTVSRTGRD